MRDRYRTQPTELLSLPLLASESSFFLLAPFNIPYILLVFGRVPARQHHVAARDSIIFASTSWAPSFSLIYSYMRLQIRLKRRMYRPLGVPCCPASLRRPLVARSRKMASARSRIYMIYLSGVRGWKPAEWNGREKRRGSGIGLENERSYSVPRMRIAGEIGSPRGAQIKDNPARSVMIMSSQGRGAKRIKTRLLLARERYRAWVCGAQGRPSSPSFSSLRRSLPSPAALARVILICGWCSRNCERFSILKQSHRAMNPIADIRTSVTPTIQR